MHWKIMFLHEMIFWVPDCSFHEMIIYNDTEWGSLKLTHCSYRKKEHETKNLSAKEHWNTKQNLLYSWSFLPNLRSDVLCLFSLWRARSYPIQSNHLLGNLRYTFTECLLANLTDLRFRKNAFESHRSNSTALLPALSHQISAVSESH